MALTSPFSAARRKNSAARVLFFFTPLSFENQAPHDVEGLGIAAVHQRLENAHGLIIVGLVQGGLRIAQGGGVVRPSHATHKQH